MSPITLDLRPSPLLCAALVSMHLLAAAAVALCRLPSGLQIGCWLVLLVSLVGCVQRYGNRRSARFIRRLRLDGTGRWWLEWGNGTRRAVCLTTCAVHPRWLVLVFSGGRWWHPSVVIPPDAADPDDLRQLRVQLMQYVAADD